MCYNPIMSTNKRHNIKQGFTLAELLIVVAIIVVLVATSVPVFAAKLEKSKQAVDLANMRDAYGTALAEWMTSSNGSDATYYYNGNDVQTEADGITGYGRSSKNATVFKGDLPAEASGIPNFSGKARVIKVNVASTGTVSLEWTSAGNATYIAAAEPYKSETLMDLKSMPNEDRIKADQKTIRALGEEILSKGWTPEQLNEQLGILTTRKDGEITGIRLADYYQEKSGDFDSDYESDGFRIESKSDLLEYLKDIGYDNGGVKASSVTGNKVSTTYNNSLFYSDELSANKLADNSNPGQTYDISETKRSIIIQNIKTKSDGTIKSFTIYSKAMDNNANLSAEQKKLFEIKVP